MIIKETNTILSAIITASEKLEGSKLEDSVLKEIECELIPKKTKCLQYFLQSYLFYRISDSLL
jgi:CRISPR/Cas system CSM-associated protein Csm4 (group 5 of RAMP superfamily)